MQPAAVQEIGRTTGRAASEIVLRWIIQQGVAAIPMSRKRANLESNLQALTFTLDDEAMSAISALGSAEGRSINRPSMHGRWDS
jgi:diketogulonate reductase-like aldo/keto reductase